MPRLRVLLLWLLMLALPLQGAAAAAMLACGMAPAAAAAASQPMPPGHAEGHEHAMPEQGMHAHDAASTPAQDHGPGHHGQPSAGDGSSHTCSLCSTCHAPALLDMPVAAALHVLPQASPALRLQAMASQAPRLPDKPPRA